MEQCKEYVGTRKRNGDNKQGANDKKERQGSEMKIIETRGWSAESVRQVCIENNLYTRGNNKEYSAMLDKVEKNYAGNKAIYAIAKDIMEHSEGQTVTNIMFLLANKAVTTIFEIVE